jgi:hypothetical protein
VPLANRDGGQSVQQPVHALRRRLRRGIATLPAANDGSIAAPTEPGGAEPLRESGDEATAADAPNVDM